MEADPPLLQASEGDSKGDSKSGGSCENSRAANGGGLVCGAACGGGTPRIPSFVATCKDMAGIQVMDRPIIMTRY